MNQAPAPVAVFAFNRLEHLSSTLQALALNELAEQTPVYLFLDGPKNNSDRSAQEKIIAYIHSGIEKKFASFTLIQSDLNKGLAQSIITGVTKTVKDFGRVIVLEDDLVTSKFFLKFMNDALEKYENDERVISIHGYVNFIGNPMKEPFFLKGADCWGWATWERGWKLFEPSGQKLLNEVRARKIERTFDFENSVHYVKMLQDQIKGKNNSWAIRWYASAILKEKLTLYPAVSFVKNIGLDGSGTHCDITSDYDMDLAKDPVIHFPTKVEPSREGYLAYANFFRSIKPSFFDRILNKLKRMMK